MGSAAEHQASERVRKNILLGQCILYSKEGLILEGKVTTELRPMRRAFLRWQLCMYTRLLGEALSLIAGATHCPLGGGMPETLYFSSVDRR